VLLTGATGFIGSRLLSMLDGHEVLCPSRDPSRLPRRDGVKGIAADLTRDGDWADAIVAFRPEWCFHLAWQGLPDYSLQRCRENLDASLRLLEVASAAGMSKMVVAGSCWEYGDAAGAVSEDRKHGELGKFAATKQALCGAIASVARSTTFEYRWARVFFAYGPGQRSTSLVPHLHRAFADGRPPELRQPAAIQDFVYVDDVAAALMALAVCDAPSGIFNIGSGGPTSVGDVANRTAQCCGAEPPFPVIPEGKGFWADMTKTAASTGWRAQVDIDEGIRRTLAADGVAV
jgi:UDP-glucose 4-epimerase